MSHVQPHRSVRWEGVHCTLEVRRPAAGVVVVVFSGMDVGELGNRPFQAMAEDLAANPSVELFIDARCAVAASVAVSNEWSTWLRRNASKLSRIHMLTATRFVQLSADLVRRFAGLEDRMRLYTDADVFDEELAEAVSRRGPFAG
jgi:hypothetical protein